MISMGHTIVRAVLALSLVAQIVVLSQPLDAASLTVKSLQPRNECNEVVVYPVPEGMATTDSFTVKVRAGKGEWMPVDLYLTRLALMNTTTGRIELQNSSMTYFDFCGHIDVSVTYNRGRIRSARVRPDSYNIVPTVRGDTLKLTLSEPSNLVIEVNDDIFGGALHLFTNPLETNVPASDDPNVIYYGPGVNSVAGGVLNVPSNKTVYIAGGGVLTAQVKFANVTNSRLRGRGMLYNNPGGAIAVEYASNISISDVIVFIPNGYAVTAGGATNLTIQGIRAFSSKGNGDGIDLFSCQTALIDRVFMRNSDDCIALYNHRWTYYGNSSDITIQNSVLWADVAHPINIGTHGNTDNPETMDNLIFKNIDILDHREMQMLYQGCIAINPGDSNLVKNVYIEDIRVEDFRLGQLVNMRVMYNSKYNTSPGRGIANVTIKNLSYSGTHANPSILVGYDEERTISNVTFENLVINGKLISDTMAKPAWYLTSDFVPMYANEWVTNLSFK